MSRVTVALVITHHNDSGFHATLHQDGQAVAPRRFISLSQYRALHFIADLYRHHTRSFAPATLTDQALMTMGIELFTLWLQPDWSALALPEGHRHLAIVTDSLELLVLPWELLKPPTADFLGVSPHWTISRVAASSLPALDDDKPWTAPPRVLFFQSQPTDRPPLDHPLTAAANVVTTGIAADLTAALLACQPQILWLHGHALVRHGTGHFCLCDHHGDSEIVTALELGQRIPAGVNLHGIVISGREENHPPPVAAIHGVASQLAAPWVVAWPDAPFSPRCKTFTAAFQQALADYALPGAIAQARQQARLVEQDSGGAGWTLPGLYR